MCAYNNTLGPYPKIPIYTIVNAIIASPARELLDPNIKSGIEEYFASTYGPSPFSIFLPALNLSTSCTLTSPDSLKTYNPSQFDAAWSALSRTVSKLDAGQDPGTYPPAVLARVFSQGPSGTRTATTMAPTSTAPSSSGTGTSPSPSSTNSAHCVPRGGWAVIMGVVPVILFL